MKNGDFDRLANTALPDVFSGGVSRFHFVVSLLGQFPQIHCCGEHHILAFPEGLLLFLLRQHLDQHSIDKVKSNVVFGMSFYFDAVGFEGGGVRPFLFCLQVGLGADVVGQVGPGHVFIVDFVNDFSGFFDGFDDELYFVL